MMVRLEFMIICHGEKWKGDGVDRAQQSTVSNKTWLWSVLESMMVGNQRLATPNCDGMYGKCQHPTVCSDVCTTWYMLRIMTIHELGMPFWLPLSP